MSNHKMITRSKDKQSNNSYINHSDDDDWFNDDDDDDDEDYEELDDRGNLKDLIDDSELKISPIKKIKKSRSGNNLSDLLINYMAMKATDQLRNNKIVSIIEESDDSDTEYKIELDLEESSSSDSELSARSRDEYDTEYEKLCNSSTNIDDNVNIKYFKNMETDKKKNIICQLKDINDINDLSTPLKFKILNSDMDIVTKSVAINQINKISEMDTSSGEYSKMDYWINGLIKIPFNKFIDLPINNESSISDKSLFLKNTHDILNKAIYGHNDAKSHILQVIGKWIKNPKSSGNILALQGPMGNGKTTLVKEGIAKAINRPFAFIALGGASDGSFFDGHNFTYEGSRWGRIIDILIQSKCMNPVIYFDELDKVSDTYKGQEIIHLLTHLTDLSQNDKFQDNYFSGINLDLSKVLFIFSFNDEFKIDPILKDRMYVINTKGFKTEDKIKISNDYLLPELLDTFKYHDNIKFNNECIKYIIENCTGKEEGVRNLKRCLETIISKVNMYELLYDNNANKCTIDLPYKIKDFKIPYVVNIDDLDELLKKIEEDKRPEHMYI